MTEDEARKKVCIGLKMASYITNAVRASGGLKREPPPVMCIASECMMWKTSPPGGYNGHNSAEIARGGHCGLAE